MRVAVGRRAEPVRVHVHRLQARREGAGHVVAQAVPDVQDRTVRGQAQRVECDGEDGRVGFGHADHGGVEDDAHGHPRRRRYLPVRHVANPETAQLGLHGAVRVRDHAHRQAEFGHGPQAVHRAGPDVRPHRTGDRAGDLGGERLTMILAHPAPGDVAEQVLMPPGGSDRRGGGQILGHHRPVVGPLERADVSGYPGGPQRRQDMIRTREDKNPARVQQDRADP